MDSAIRDGNQVPKITLEVSNQKTTMTIQVTTKILMTMRTVMKKVYNKKKMKMMNKVITTFEKYEMNEHADMLNLHNILYKIF
jgi:hypothetical protein